MIEAAFENGVLRPTRRLALRSGERVGIVIVRRPDPARRDVGRLSMGSAEETTLMDEGLADWGASLDHEDRR
jgi:predicted DNA-binding antitoxin AbrB/MazE fold protein